MSCSSFASIDTSSFRGQTPPRNKVAFTERRVEALDGIRGLMTILVVLSHYFAEVPYGLTSLAFGWVAVDMFFVLSGLLVGRLIIEKGSHDNFLRVFYIRRICRTFPSYFVCVAAAVAISVLVPTMRALGQGCLPTWSYFTFLQNIFMAAHGDVGLPWLAPTWTLAVEEQFYLFVPAVMLLTPRRGLLPLLVAIIVAAVGLRFMLLMGTAGPVAALVTLPSRADNLTCGLVAAALLSWASVKWENVGYRMIPIGLLTVATMIHVMFGVVIFTGIGHLLVAVACAIFLMSIVRGAPEATRFHSRTLRFFGSTSYAVYLTHLPILWIMHAALRGAEPSLIDATGWAATFLALPVCGVVGYILTKAVEEPFTSFGRSFKWRAAPELSSTGAPRRYVGEPTNSPARAFSISARVSVTP